MLEMIIACAPNVAPSTIQEIIRVESEGKPFAVNVNRFTGRLPPVKTAQEAIALTYAAMRYGYTVDMGYMQINSANLKWLGYTVEDMFLDPCKNIAAGAKVLSEAYSKELPKHKNEQAALRAALSKYNTGNARDGFSNGYVRRYFK
jgi:type IV secretion system protein VirB1